MTNREKIKKTNQQWREQLTAEQYRISRQKGTEPAFTGEYNDTDTPGVYHCICCGQALFDSGAKFKSGSGWPSFTKPVDDENVEKHLDRSHGMARTEVVCSHCDAHLGHVFDDGPDTTGQRYCINSASLDLNENQ